MRKILVVWALVSCVVVAENFPVEPTESEIVHRLIKNPHDPEIAAWRKNPQPTLKQKLHNADAIYSGMTEQQKIDLSAPAPLSIRDFEAVFKKFCENGQRPVDKQMSMSEVMAELVKKKHHTPLKKLGDIRRIKLSETEKTYAHKAFQDVFRYVEKNMVFSRDLYSSFVYFMKDVVGVNFTHHVFNSDSASDSVEFTVRDTTVKVSANYQSGSAQ